MRLAHRLAEVPQHLEDGLACAILQPAAAGRVRRQDHCARASVGTSETSHPPPIALISSTLASIRRRRMSTAFRSLVSAMLWAVMTWRYVSHMVKKLMRLRMCSI